MDICIVGLGLLGGSFALGIKNKNPEYRILGVDINNDHCNKAISLGIVNKILNLDDALQQSKVIILAIPVDALLKILPGVLDKISDIPDSTERNVKMLLSTRFFNHILSSLTLVEHGLLADSIICERSAIETLAGIIKPTMVQIKTIPLMNT